MAAKSGVSSLKHRRIQRQLNALKEQDETLHNVLAVDIWALAKTIDEFQPGFWAEFMKTRDKALRRFLQETLKSDPTVTKRHPFLT